ncbi:hypothetical protein GUJ93_ZPchr0003g17056 [Zizania palustris]|uniref:Cupin type-1 domain-containing protein n=1 Tax=Zizania palustris TaxID=103762 RepID=A0A8J5S0U6_ZIZPA|nr:hypothetical protein GUJ93_ZPchr0003g17056 [Zizania palustris]
MACPHISGGGRSEHAEREREDGRRREVRGREEEHGGGQKARSYKQVRAQIREGSVVVIPAAHPTTLVAGDNENLAILCFGVGANHDEMMFLTGKNSVLKQLDEPAKELVFGSPVKEVDRVLGAQPEEVFLRGPHNRGGFSDMILPSVRRVPPKGLRRWYLRKGFGGWASEGCPEVVSPKSVRCLLAAAVQRSVLVGGVWQYTMTGFVPKASGLRRRRTRFEPGEPGSSGRLDARGAGSSVTVATKVVWVGPRVEACQVKAESAERGSD